MQTMRDKWTDERLDDLNAKVDHGFDRLDTDIRDLRVVMRDLRAEMNARFDAIERKIEAMQRQMFWFAGALIIAIVASNLAG